jgi:hypothetical protein
MHYWTEYVDWQAFSAISTFLVVVVALLGPVIQHWLFRAQFKIKMPRGMGDPAKFNDGRQAHYFHLHVLNTRTFIRVHDCHVLLLKVETPAEDGGWRVRWTGPLQTRWKYQEANAIRIRLLTHGNPADAFYCDETGKIGLSLLASPYNLQGLQDESGWKLRLTFIVDSNEGTSNEIELVICWDGTWSSNRDELRKHLNVTLDGAACW